MFEGHKMKSYELETWIDGPEATYGYMDDHKKSMIQKWVETQNAQVQPKGSEHGQKSPKHKQYKELTQFKTVDEDEAASQATPSPRHKDKHREKRKSSECKDARKEHSTPSRDKDSTPRKRRSYGEKAHLSHADHDEAKARPHAVAAEVAKPEARAPPSQEAPEPPRDPRGSHIAEVPEATQSVAAASSAASECSGRSGSRVPAPATDANANAAAGAAAGAAVVQRVVSDDVCDVRLNLKAQGPTRGREGAPEGDEDEDDEVLQVIYTEKDASKQDLHSAPSQDIEVDKSSSTRSSSEETTTGEGGDPLEEDVSQASSEELGGDSLAEEIIHATATRIFLREVRDLDEGEEELEAALDRWLAEEDREYIEVEEPEEPVEMVDSWCQVTEEDIERTLAEAGVHFIPFLPHRHLLPTLQEDPSEAPSESAGVESSETLSVMSLRAQSETKEEALQPLRVAEDAAKTNNNFMDEQCAQDAALGLEYKPASRYEQMINDPNFTAKTHYFAKRLEELQQLHELYRNLAKQAPRWRGSIHSPSALKEPSEVSEDDSSVSEGGEEPEPKVLPQPFFSQEGTLTSLKLGGEYEFNWKSLLPEEIALQSEAAEGKNEGGDDTASEVSKDVNDPLYDIQSDIMPYLPSNYVSLSTLTALRQPDGASNPNLNGELARAEPQSVAAPAEEGADAVATATAVVALQERLPGNGASLSDDESNVKQVKVKKEKRKKKLGLLSKSSNKSGTFAKDEGEGDENSTSSKLSWSRFFGSPRHKGSPKESSKKSGKSSSKSSSKSPTSSSKNSEKSDKKSQRERERSKESKASASKESKGNKEGKAAHSQESHHGQEAGKQADNKSAKAFQKMDSERSNGSLKNKSPARKSSENRSGRSGRRESREQQQQSQQTQQQQQQQQQQQGQGQRYQGFQWDSPLPPFLPVSTASIHPGYDSGADSGVGLKVIPRTRRSRGESRHGESSGYESVIRDSECSSFGSSQDSGLDDDGLKGKAEGKGSENLGEGPTVNKELPLPHPKLSQTISHNLPSSKHPASSSSSPLSSPSCAAHHHSHSHSKTLPASRVPSGASLTSTAPRAGGVASSVAPASSSASSSPKGHQTSSSGGSSSSCASASQRAVLEDFDEEDVARYESHKTEEDIAKCRRTQEKIRALREKQDQLKRELEAAKSRLMIDKSRWSFELHVEEAMTWRDDGYVEALQQETIILAKRVMAARSRLLLSTCFDASPTLQDHPSFGEAVAAAAAAEGGGLEDLSVIDEEEEGAAVDADLGEACRDGSPCIKGFSEMESRGYWAALRRTQGDAAGGAAAGGGGGGDGGARGARQEAEKAEAKKRPDKGDTSDSERGQGLEAVGRSDRIESVVKISEGFNVEDWRRLKESFIL